VKYVKLFREFIDFGGEGTEGEVYVDDDYAYKFVASDIVGEIDDIRKYIGKTHPNVVTIYDVWENDEDMIIIKMEKLQDIPMNKVSDVGEFERISKLLWNSQDDIYNIRGIKSSDPEVQKMVDAIISAKEHVGYLDIGFHNLMYDPKTDEYKQIDIF
jgi:hypothetical protein